MTPKPAALVRGGAMLLMVVAIWEALRLLVDPPKALMPAARTIVRALWEGLRYGSLPGQLLLSLGYILGALAIACLAAVVLVAIARVFPGFRNPLSSLTSLLHPLPGVALLPVVILWAGVGPVATLTVVVHSVLWPLVTNLLAGVESVPEVHRLLGRNLGFSRGALFLKIELPGSTPSLLAGGRVAWSRGWRAFISAEMIFGAVAGDGGLGWYLFNRRVFMDSAGLFAGLLLVMIVGTLVENGVFAVIEGRTIRRWGISRS
jgi:NitT/TauT family transport system permease protein